jgi:phosphopantothenoylcysteine decarboxylase / phosphopantothenate---cysteine ligase
MKGKRILIGITGSIAAYKTATLVRLLVKAGADVRVIMTSAAKEFITPLTLSVLSKHPVLTEPFDLHSGEWTNHVELGTGSDLLLIAPASANTLAKMAGGICDNLLLTVWLSARCPVFVAPAMDLDMWNHPTTRMNLEKLRSFGVQVIQPTEGELASGLSGEGRMEEPEQIFLRLEKFFSADKPLKGKRALVSAGPTHEAIDPVRFIGNRSSGKMGFAIAEELASKGAEVTLIAGPTGLQLNNPSIRRIDTETAAEMHAACMNQFPSADITVMAAAVADYKPQKAAAQKLKKKDAALSIELVPTLDILSEMGRKKKKNQWLVGFALETNKELEYAKQKLKNKNLDLIVLNSLREKGAGFGHDTNKITILGRNGKVDSFPLKHKDAVATDIVERIIRLTKNK